MLMGEESPASLYWRLVARIMDSRVRAAINIPGAGCCTASNHEHGEGQGAVVVTS